MKEYKSHLKSSWSDYHGACGTQTGKFVKGDPTCKNCLKKHTTNQLDQENWAILIEGNKPYNPTEFKVFLIKNFNISKCPSPWDRLNISSSLIYTWQYITNNIPNVWIHFSKGHYLAKKVKEELFPTTKVDIFLEHIEVFVQKGTKLIKANKDDSSWRV